MDILIQPYSTKALGDFLQEVFDGKHGDYKSFQAAVAYAKKSGVQHLEERIKTFVDAGKSARVIVGIDQQGTSIEGLQCLLQALGEKKLYINHDENSFVTFHPKIYYFDNDKEALLIIGSGNLTQGGLYSNDEGFAILRLDQCSVTDRETIEQIKRIFELWCDDCFGTVKEVNDVFVNSLKDLGYIISESINQGSPDTEPADERTDRLGGDPTNRIIVAARLFGRGASRRRPPRPKTASKVRSPRTAATPSPLFGHESGPEPSTGFIMTLMRTDVGSGQITPGTSRRSPEIFIPLAARDANPEFWGWKDKFTEDASRPGKFDRPGVRMRLGGEVIKVNMMTWPDKHDFRLRSESLRSAGNIGDLIRVEKTEGSEYFDYYVEIIPEDTSDFDYYNDFCTINVKNSKRRWGYY